MSVLYQYYFSKDCKRTNYDSYKDYEFSNMKVPNYEKKTIERKQRDHLQSLFLSKKPESLEEYIQRSEQKTQENLINMDENTLRNFQKMQNTSKNGDNLQRLDNPQLYYDYDKTFRSSRMQQFEDEQFRQKTLQEIHNYDGYNNDQKDGNFVDFWQKLNNETINGKQIKRKQKEKDPLEFDDYETDEYFQHLKEKRGWNTINSYMNQGSTGKKSKRDQSGGKNNVDQYGNKITENQEEEDQEEFESCQGDVNDADQIQNKNAQRVNKTQMPNTSQISAISQNSDSKRQKRSFDDDNIIDNDDDAHKKQENQQYQNNNLKKSDDQQKSYSQDRQTQKQKQEVYEQKNKDSISKQEKRQSGKDKFMNLTKQFLIYNDITEQKNTQSNKRMSEIQKTTQLGKRMQINKSPLNDSTTENSNKDQYNLQNITQNINNNNQNQDQEQENQNQKGVVAGQNRFSIAQYYKDKLDKMDAQEQQLFYQPKVESINNNNQNFNPNQSFSKQKELVTWEQIDSNVKQDCEEYRKRREQHSRSRSKHQKQLDDIIGQEQQKFINNDTSQYQKVGKMYQQQTEEVLQDCEHFINKNISSRKSYHY